MKNQLGNRIRKIREGKGLKQENVAIELGMTKGGYSKIERGETDVPASRIIQIAEVLEVNAGEFFFDISQKALKDEKTSYGYATKEDVEQLLKQITVLTRELDKMRQELQKPAPARKTKRKK